jgi:tetratricopeptide (TPR) repeat protein
MSLKDKLSVLLKSGYEEEKALYGRIDQNERLKEGTLEKWTVKDIIGHITYWKKHTVENIKASLQGENPQKVDNLEKVNEEVFNANRDSSWEEITAYQEQVYYSFNNLVVDLHDRWLDNAETLPWQEGRRFWRIIAGSGYLHPIAHIAEYYFRRGENDLGISLHEKSASLTKDLSDDPEWVAVVKYNLACCHALSGQPQKAIDGLRESLKLNPDLTEWSKEDPDFSSIREYHDYKMLYESKNDI